MQRNNIDFNALGQVTDTSWGRPSTPTPQRSVKFKISGSCIVATYQTIVNMGTEHERIMMRRRAEQEAIGMVASTIKRVKADYKQISGSALTLEELDSHDSLEIVGASPYSPRRTALYKRHTTYKLS